MGPKATWRGQLFMRPNFEIKSVLKSQAENAAADQPPTGLPNFGEPCRAPSLCPVELVVS